MISTAHRCIATAMVGLLTLSSFAAEYPAPRNTGDPAKLGLGIQRTMTLLASSTPERRNTVRILFYGQSITEQDWAKRVAEDLRKRFPHANLIIENRALGGWSSQVLVKDAESALYSFYPDLMIFYVYGSHLEYENIIKRTRQRTTAEILMQMDHCTKDEDFKEETDPAKLTPKLWNSFMNFKFLPETAKKYGCGVVDQRNLWKQYLQENKLAPKQLLRDGVHLNDHGCYLMAQFVNAALTARSDVKVDPMNCETVKTLVVGKDIHWSGGKLAVDFDGNRVDLIAKEGASAGAPAKILIDGKKPSEIGELYGFTRALPKPGGKWPAVTMMRSNALPLLEDWTMQVAKDPSNEKLFTFSIEGSKTGPDGEGRSDQAFVSKSGRIVIDPQGWEATYALMLAGQKPAPAKFTVKWSVVLQGADEWVVPAVQDKAIEPAVTIAQGLKNQRHQLQIAGDPATPLAAIRIYRPSLAGGQ